MIDDQAQIQLEARELEVAYGDFQVLWGISLGIPRGEISCLLGTNGSGKSTFLNAVCGMVPIKAGSVWFDGRRVDRQPTHRRVEEGLVLVPERRRLFPEMSVWENLWLGGWIRRARRQRGAMLEMIYELFPVLQQKRDQRVGELSGGQQQMVAIGRGLMAQPSLLVLDEPFLGISEHMVEVISGVIRQINADGVSILLIDQDVRRALTLAHKGFVLDAGRLVLSGEAGELIAGDRIQAIYLGERGEGAEDN